MNCDITIFLDGVHGDMSETFLVGEVDTGSRRLVEVTRECMYLGLAAVTPGAPVNVIGRAIADHAEQAGFGVVRDFVGHGIGEVFHMPPNVPHYFDPGATRPLVVGMTFTVEPMITAGSIRPRIWSDGWTAVTSDLSRTAEYEHTVLVREDGVEILTVGADEPQPFLGDRTAPWPDALPVGGAVTAPAR